MSKVTLCEISEKQYSFKLSGMCWREEDHSRKKRIVGCGIDSHLLFCVLWQACVCASVCGGVLCVCVSVGISVCPY